MTNKLRVEVIPHYERHIEGLRSALERHNVKATCNSFNCYQLTSQDALPARNIIKEVLSTDSKEHCNFETSPVFNEVNFLLEIGYLPGVTDNIARSCHDAFNLKGYNLECFSSQLVAISFLGECNISKDELEKISESLLYNKLIQSLRIYDKSELRTNNRFNNIVVPTVNISHNTSFDYVSLRDGDESLESLSKERCLALTLDEMKVIKSHYEESDIRSVRKGINLENDPTDVELEVIAQTWSEHCKHKIFAANINYIDEVSGKTKKINSLYKSYIKQATKDINSDFLISVFSDNAGIVRFDNKIDVCIKAETHNSPSALDPYGGALTGILGVNRDIMGCGLGAKPIANTNVFCVGEMELAKTIGHENMPKGLMEPAKILKGIHAGVRDGGNKSGIPTVNGAMFFDDSYAGKPLVFCGTVGVMPPKLKDGRESKLKGAAVGDYVFVAGGSVGADGIHGATFSSLDLNEDSPATAVQIGDPITQKRLLDFLIEARDEGLFTCVTDNGAGGISSSIGEMATLTNGCTIDLAKNPVKYPGLSPWEIMISESQERMTFAVAKENAERFENLAKTRNVNVSKLGEFNDSGFLDIFYNEERVGQLSMHFLHEGLPQMNLEAKWSGKRDDEAWNNKTKETIPSDIYELLPVLLNKENIASKRDWVKQYDQEVQAGTQIKPFVGKKQRSPGNSGVVSLENQGGEINSAVSIGCGLAPRWSSIDAKTMAMLSVDEAVRNIIATGANPDKICLLDNFCWPDPIKSTKTPDGEEKLGDLVRSCEGLYDICTLYKAPLVSGKDSMKNDFRGVNNKGDALKISIKPTLLVTAMGHVDSRYTCESYLKNEESTLFVIGRDQRTLIGSEVAQHYNVVNHNNMEMDFDNCLHTYKGIHTLITKGLMSSCHDISEGGFLCALSEKCFDNDLEVNVNIKSSKDDLLRYTYGEGPGQFIVSVNNTNLEKFNKTCKDINIDLEEIGFAKTSSKGKLHIQNNGEKLANFNCDDLLDAWQRKW
jgi:phosphoribosylformylglycinamidine synthase